MTRERIHTLLSVGLAVLAFGADAAKIAIIIDDVGYNLARGERVLALPGPVSIAVLPYTPHSRSIAERASAAGKEVLLHQPLESDRANREAEGTLNRDMPSATLQSAFEASIASIPNIVGVNNHTGSAFTRHGGSMHALMEVMHRRGLFFVDSRTTPDTVALDVARDWGVPATRRDVFLDHSLSWRDIDQAFTRAFEIAARQGHVVLIAHPHELTLRYLEARLPTLRDGTLVPVSTVTRSARRATPDRLGSLAFARRLPSL